MNVPAALPFAKYLGLPTRKKSKLAARPKSRSRERKTAAPVSRQTLRKAAAMATRCIVRKVAAAPHQRSFAELLDVASVETRAVPRRAPPSPPARVEAPRNRDQLTPAARRILELAAEARGESPIPDGIEAQLRRERDQACGITSTARAIIDRKAARA